NVLTLSSSATDRLFLRMTVTSGDLYPSLVLTNAAAGHSIGPVLEFIDFPIFVTAGESYDLRIPSQIGGGVGFGSGSYKIYFQSVSNPVDATTLEYGDSLQAEITEPGEIDSYLIDGVTG